jgi:hypothetical protein
MEASISNNYLHALFDLAISLSLTDSSHTLPFQEQVKVATPTHHSLAGEEELAAFTGGRKAL